MFGGGGYGHRTVVWYLMALVASLNLKVPAQTSVTNCGVKKKIPSNFIGFSVGNKLEDEFEYYGVGFWS